MIYIRASGQSDRLDQEKLCTGYAGEQGWSVLSDDHYCDTGREGGAAWKKLRQDLLDREAVSAVIVRDLSLISRDAEVVRAIEAELAHMGVELRVVRSDSPQAPRGRHIRPPGMKADGNTIGTEGKR